MKAVLAPRFLHRQPEFCRMQKKGYSLLECIVAAVLIALTMTGLANLFVAGKRHVIRSRARMAAAELGRVFLDHHQMEVRQDQWNDAAIDYNVPNKLRFGTRTETAQTIDGIAYTPTYIVDVPVGYVASETQMRRIRLKINWEEPKP